MKNNKKNRAFTLAEVILAVFIFSILVLSFSATMFSAYSNTRNEMDLTKDMYETQGTIEEVSAKIKNLTLEVDEEIPEEDFEDLLEEYGYTEDNIKRIQPFNVFSGVSSGIYSSQMSGYTISEDEQNSSGLSTLAFVSNRGKETFKLELKTPLAEERPYIENYSLKTDLKVKSNELESYNFGDLEFFYLYNDYLSSHPVYGDYNDGTYSYLKGKYTIDPETAIFLDYTTYAWHFADSTYTFTNSGGETVTRKSEPLFKSSYGEYAVPRSFYPTDEAYNLSSEINKVSSTQKLSINTLKGKIDKDTYVKFFVTPHNTYVSPITADADPVWAIALPYTEDLLYHFDMSMEGPFLESGESIQILKVKDLPNFYNIKANPSSGKYLKKEDGTSFNIYKDPVYGKYIKLSGSKEFAYEDTRSVWNYNRGRLTLFMVVDFDDATSSGSIISRVNYSKPNRKALELYYDKDNSKLYFYSGKEDKKSAYGAVQNVIGPGKHIIVAEVDWKYIAWPPTNQRTNYLKVDNSDFDSKVHSESGSKKYLQRDEPLELGGADGVKVYEIIGYEYALNDSDVSEIYNYLKNKYDID